MEAVLDCMDHESIVTIASRPLGLTLYIHSKVDNSLLSIPMDVIISLLPLQSYRRRLRNHPKGWTLKDAHSRVGLSTCWMRALFSEHAAANGPTKFKHAST